MNTPKVSIITPTYNHEAFLSDCINSVKSQTFSNWEMIIVDDGSTDNTLQLASKFASVDSRISVFTQSNRGIYALADTYNFALEKAKGEYVAILEGDDVWIPEKLQIQIDALDKDQEAILSWGKAFASSSDLEKTLFILPVTKFHQDIFFNFPVKSALKSLLFSSHMPALTMVIRKEVLLEIGGFVRVEGLPTTDLPTWQKLAIKGKFTYIDLPLGHWRSSGHQATKTYTMSLIRGVSDLAIQLFNQNKLYFESIGFKEDQLKKYFEKRIVVNHHYAGINHFKRDEIEDAKKEFLLCITKHGLIKPLWKVRSIFWYARCLFVI